MPLQLAGQPALKRLTLSSRVPASSLRRLAVWWLLPTASPFSSAMRAMVVTFWAISADAALCSRNALEISATVNST